MLLLQVEFNKAALSLSDAIPEVQKKAALTRLLKVGADALTWSLVFRVRLSGTHTQTGQQHFQQDPDQSACVSIRFAPTTSCRAAAQQACKYSKCSLSSTCQHAAGQSYFCSCCFALACRPWFHSRLARLLWSGLHVIPALQPRPPSCLWPRQVMLECSSVTVPAGCTVPCPCCM